MKKMITGLTLTLVIAALVATTVFAAGFAPGGRGRGDGQPAVTNGGQACPNGEDCPVGAPRDARGGRIVNGERPDGTRPNGDRPNGGARFNGGVCANDCVCPTCGAAMVGGVCPEDGTKCTNTENCPNGGVRPQDGTGRRGCGNRVALPTTNA